MALCDSGCSISVPCAYGNACGVQPKEGGIVFIGFVACDFEFTDVTDCCEWIAGVENGDIVWSGLLTASKEKGTFEKKMVDSCANLAVMGGTKVINFIDYNDSVVSGAVHEFWNTILLDPASYRLVFLTCDGWLYGPIDDFTLECDEVIDDTIKGTRHIEGTITWNSTV